MRHFKLYLNLLLLLAIGFVSCQDNFDRPPVMVPQAAHIDKVNTTILDLKKKFWSDDKNCIDTIKLTEAGDSMVIKGRVVSSDAAGNIYKNLVIQDETAALTLSINGTSLYNTYRIGQEVVLPVTDLFIGKYNNLMQLGYPDYSESFGWQATFMPLALFQSKVELNGLPDASKIDTVTVKLSELPTTPEGLQKWQSQLVRLDNVTFTEADGSAVFAPNSTNTSRNLQDDAGNTIIVRNSGYANFKNDILPLGTGSVVGILSYYGSAWQLLLRDTDDCIGFSTDTKGTKDNPYDMTRAIELQGTGKIGWMTGYLVGAVAPEVTAVSSNADIEWKAPTTLANTIVIGATPDTKDINQCVIVELAEGTSLRSSANLKDNPKALGSEIKLKGEFKNVMGKYGVVCSGSTDDYVMAYVGGGVKSLKEDFSGAAIPANWGNVQLKGDKKWYTPSFDNNYYAAMTGYKGTAPFDSWLITPALDVDGAAKKVLSFKSQVNGYGSTTTTMKVFVLSSADPASATRTELNCQWATAPASGYSGWTESGEIDLSKFSGTIFIGFQFAATQDANYATWCIDDVVFGEDAGTGGGGEDPNPPVVSATQDDFETMNNGAAVGSYGTYTSTAGWVAKNCNVLTGGASDSNPMFMFIGYKTGSTTQYAFAPCLNGKTASVGTLTSPTLTGGCKELTFSYGQPYTETSGVSFRVDIKQNGTVVKTETVTEKTEKLKAYSKTISVNVTGDFSIEFTNLSPTQTSDKNKDRVCIWNVNWTK